MLKLPKIILASNSPARANILKQIGFSFEIKPSNIKETISSINPKELVTKISSQKAFAVGNEILKQQDDISAVIIACDTITLNGSGKIIGKPLTFTEAKNMLEGFSNKVHDVITGCTLLILPERTEYQKVIVTEVKFRDLSQNEINFYLNNEKWNLRAGGYAIQDLGAILIEEIRGDYYNVVGLPIHWVWETMYSHYGESIFSLVRS
ncbi:Maf family protein [Candidatus Hodarchaeum mangrovi]